MFEPPRARHFDLGLNRSPLSGSLLDMPAPHPTPLGRPLKPKKIKVAVREIVARTPVYDIHTHVYDPAFGPLLLWGIDELLVYHYLVAEGFRHHHLPPDRFWALSKTEQANLIWENLFLAHSPISESCRGVLTCLHALGLDVQKRDLPSLRKHFSKWKIERFLDQVLDLSGVERVVMTNNPFDDLERPLWLKGWKRDERFEAALRLDDILMTWEKAVPRLRGWGFDVGLDCSRRTLDETRRFLHEWIERTKPLYLAVSLPPSFAFPDLKATGPEAIRNHLLAEAVLPECEEHHLPFAMMIGVKKLVNPDLRLAGDSVGRADPGVVERLCAAYPKNKFLVTMLSRENQHEICIVARKFANLHVFGCWWFLNNPSIIEEMTRERIELLGLSVTPQHSDARVLDQLIYKWIHFRGILADVLVDMYTVLARTGWAVTEDDIRRDVQDLLGGAFRRFLK